MRGLRDAGMVIGARVGRHVMYRLTDRGTGLLEPFDGRAAAGATRSTIEPSASPRADALDPRGSRFGRAGPVRRVR